MSYLIDSDWIIDSLNAATALHHTLALVTRNHDDYDDIPGLTLHKEDVPSEPNGA